MGEYTIHYNRTSNHISGLLIRTAGDGSQTDPAFNACPVLTRGTSLARGKSFTEVAEALKAARSSSAATGRKLCKKCEQAAEAMV